MRKYDSQERVENTPQDKPQEESAGDSVGTCPSGQRTAGRRPESSPSLLKQVRFKPRNPPGCLCRIFRLKSVVRETHFYRLVEPVGCLPFLRERLAIGYGLKLGALDSDKKAEYGRIEPVKGYFPD